MAGPEPRNEAVTPVTVLAAPEPAIALDALVRWFGQRPQQRQWALLLDQADFANADTQALLARLPADAVQGLGAGCICCVGAAGLRVTLARVLRQRQWDRIFILASAAARIPALVDALRSSLSGARLRIDSILALASSRGADNEAPFLPAAGVAHEVSVTEDWDSIAARLGLDGLAREPDQWLCWPGEIVFDRMRLLRVLGQLRATRPELAMRGVFRTAREWYCWEPDAGDSLQPSDWRLDSRLMCALTDAEILEFLRLTFEAAIDRGDSQA